MFTAYVNFTNGGQITITSDWTSPEQDVRMAVDTLLFSGQVEYVEFIDGSGEVVSTIIPALIINPVDFSADPDLNLTA